MTLQYLFDVSEKYPNSVIGYGMADAIGMIVIPAPKYNTQDKPAPYGASTEELALMRALWKKLNLNPDLFFITTAVPKGPISPEAIAEGQQRLKDITYAISPKLVVCCGFDAWTAFCGPGLNKNMKNGWVLSSDVCGEYTVYYTHDFSDYLARKAKEIPGWEGIAKEIMEDWTIIKNAADDILGE